MFTLTIPSSSAFNTKALGPGFSIFSSSTPTWHWCRRRGARQTLISPMNFSSLQLFMFTLTILSSSAVGHWSPWARLLNLFFFNSNWTADGRPIANLLCYQLALLYVDSLPLKHRWPASTLLAYLKCCHQCRCLHHHLLYCHHLHHRHCLSPVPVELLCFSFLRLGLLLNKIIFFLLLLNVHL